MNARWDLFLPVLLVVAYSSVMWALGYHEGKRNAELRYERKANLRRRVMAREKQLYDWETHGL
jgi:hypothetical protein